MDTKISRKQLYDPYRGEFVYDIVPTHSVKRSRSVPATAGTYGNLASYSIGPGTVGRLVYLHIDNNRGTAGFALIDRYGTLDQISARGAVSFTQQGDHKAPIHVLFGTFKLRKFTAATTGTVTSASWEMVITTGVPGREGTATRY